MITGLPESRNSRYTKDLRISSNTEVPLSLKLIILEQGGKGPRKEQKAVAQDSHMELLSPTRATTSKTGEQQEPRPWCLRCIMI